MFPICLKYLVRNSKRNFKAYLKVTDLKPMNSKQTSKMNKAIPSIFFHPRSRKEPTKMQSLNQQNFLKEKGKTSNFLTQKKTRLKTFKKHINNSNHFFLVRDCIGGLKPAHVLRARYMEQVPCQLNCFWTSRSTVGKVS